MSKLRSLDLKKFTRLATAIAINGPSAFRLARKAITEKQAVQRTWELMSLISLVDSLKPRVVLEIGTHNGGTLYCWPHVAKEDALLISLDLPGGEFDGGYREEAVANFRTYLQHEQTLKCLRTDSHLRATYDEVVCLLAGRKIDFLFIDGDHTYDGVKADFHTYGPLVRPGGLIAFHDINANPAMPHCQVHLFWREIKDGHKHLQFIDQDSPGEHGMGIGVLIQRQ